MGNLLTHILETVGSAGVFSGTNFALTTFFDHDDGERKRHDLATEKLQKARDAWVKERQQKIDFINERLRKEKQAQEYINDLDVGMRLYYEATKQRLPPLSPEPKLSDFYHPSEAQKTGEILFITTGFGIMGFLIYKYA